MSAELRIAVNERGTGGEGFCVESVDAAQRAWPADISSALSSEYIMDASPTNRTIYATTSVHLGRSRHGSSKSDKDSDAYDDQSCSTPTSPSNILEAMSNSNIRSIAPIKWDLRIRKIAIGTRDANVEKCMITSMEQCEGHNMIICGIIPGPKSPGDMISILQPLVDDFVKWMGTYGCFQLLICMKGTNGKHPCGYCTIDSMWQCEKYHMYFPMTPPHDYDCVQPPTLQEAANGLDGVWQIFTAETASAI
ncbi:hypothetical protein BJ742DRAFT_738980 [Cladochytrium replicatum]|nr:hypothetical protein BJ742DRAFT_738980 [Cladochytrium replicatum]